MNFYRDRMSWKKLRTPSKRKLTAFEQKEEEEYSKQCKDRSDAEYEENSSRRRNPVRYNALINRLKLEHKIYVACKQ